MQTHVQWLSERIVAEAGAAFDAWREEHDPNHKLSIEQAAEAYCRHAFANQSRGEPI